MKIRLIEGEPATILSGPFLRLDLSTHDAVVVVRDRTTIRRIAMALLKDGKKRAKPPEK